MNRKISIAAFIILQVILITACAAAATRQLALQLSAEDDHAPAAIEFRRLALGGTDESTRGGYYWLAGYHYSRMGDVDRAEDMLDRAEDLDLDLIDPASLLRAGNSLRRRRGNEAVFYYQSLLSDEGDMARYSAQRLAALKMRAGEFSEAEALLREHNRGDVAALESLRHYRAGQDKSPLVGGLLGMVPGLGHFYSGEYANGLRAMILNAVFIYGMVETASNDHWGAFAVITFFELTWYSGSVYGGIDAAHRHNRDRLDSAIDGIEGEATFQPDWRAAPTIRLEFSF